MTNIQPMVFILGLVLIGVGFFCMYLSYYGLYVVEMPEGGGVVHIPPGNYDIIGSGFDKTILRRQGEHE